MIMTFNNKLPIDCPKCKHTMQLGDSVENIDETLEWDSGCWTEKYVCPNCGHTFYTEIIFNINVTDIHIDDNEEEEE